MDNSNQRGLPVAQIENPSRLQAENFCLKINLTEDEYKIEFEHRHNQKAPIHVHELALACADVLPRLIAKTPIGNNEANVSTVNNGTTTANINPRLTTPVNIGSYTGTTDNRSIIAENQKLNAEILLLRQRNQELERNVALLRKGNENLENLIGDLKKTCQSHERKLTQLNELSEQAFKANKDLIEGFRAATHAKADRLASQCKVDTNHAKAIDNGTRHVLTPAASSTQAGQGPLVLSKFEQEPHVFLHNPKLKEIDFFSLEDILGKDDRLFATPEKKFGGFSDENNEAVANSSNSITETSFDDNEMSPGDSSLEKLELPKAAPPNILKVGLDVGIARAGGVCQPGISFGSPVYRHYRARDLHRKIVSYAEHDDTLYAEDELPGHNSKMVNVRYNPSLNSDSELKGVFLGNLPLSINYEKLLAKIRGGTIISATLCDTRAVAGCARRMSALIVFIDAESAKSYVEFACEHGIFFESERAVATLISTPTYPLSVQAKNRIECNHHTRYFMIREDGSNLDLVKITRIINFDVNEYRKEAIEKAWKDEHGNVRILFASISAASNAHWRLTKQLFYDPSKVEFQDDPCGEPLTDLLSHDRPVVSTGLKLNYDDEVFDNKNIKDVKPMTLAVSKIVNDNEIDIDDDDAENSEAGNEPSGMESSKRDHDGIQETIKDTSLMDFDTGVEKGAKSRVIAEAETPQGEDLKESSEITNSDTLGCSDLTKPENVAQLQNCEEVKTSSIAEDEVMEKPIAEGTIEGDVGTITPTTPEPSRFSSEAASYAAKESIATPINSTEAVEKPDSKSTPSPQTSSPPSKDSSPINIESPKTPDSDIAVIEEADTKSASSPEPPALEKFNLDGTDLDPVLLPRYVFDTVLAAKPRGGLSSSKWADPETEPAAPIIVQAPDAVPLLSDAAKPAYELLFGKGSYDDNTDHDPQQLPLATTTTTAPPTSRAVPSVAEPAPTTTQQPTSQAPANAPKGPRAGLPNSRWAATGQAATEDSRSIDTTAVPALKSTPPTGPKLMPHKPRSRYFNLHPDSSQPRSTLRSFYSDVDSTAAPKRN